MQVIVETLFTNYQSIGTGSKKALFLHGWADSLQTFNSLAKQFVQDSPDYTAVLLDLPGFGKTQAPPEAWGLSQYAAFVQSFAIKTALKPTIIVGHSNGGAIAINGLSNGTLHASGLVLLASAGIRSASIRNTLLKLVAAPIKVVLSTMPQAAQKKVKQKAYGAIGSDYMVSEHMTETFKKIVSNDVTKQAATLKIPTLLIYGEDDKATPPQYGKQFAAVIPQSQLTIIPETGHFIHQEQVYTVATIVSDFVKTL